MEPHCVQHGHSKPARVYLNVNELKSTSSDALATAQVLGSHVARGFRPGRCRRDGILTVEGALRRGCVGAPAGPPPHPSFPSLPPLARLSLSLSLDFKN